MKRSQYLFRLDDICPTMDWRRLGQLESLFSQFNIKPIIGSVPDNQDPALVVGASQPGFWVYMRQLKKKGWVVAQHGYQHIYKTKDSGILKINQRSEFAGLPYDEQYQAISAGQAILKKHLGEAPTWWMAPAHSFDATTCQVLKNLSYTHLTDGVALYPFTTLGLTWVPQQLWQPRRMPFGIWTICLHPNTMKDADIHRLRSFVKDNHQACQSFDTQPRFNFFNPMFRAAWYFYLHSLQNAHEIY